MNFHDTVQLSLINKFEILHMQNCIILCYNYLDMKSFYVLYVISNNNCQHVLIHFLFCPEIMFRQAYISSMNTLYGLVIIDEL